MTDASRLVRRLACRRPKRPLFQGLAAAAVLCAAGPAGSVITTTCCYGGVRDVILRVGTATAGVIDVVRFDVGGPPVGNVQAAAPNPHGNGVPVAAATGAVPIYLRVRAPASVLPQQITVTVSSPANLTCLSGCGTIPFSEISWTVTNPAAGDFVNGTLGGTSTILGPVTFNGFFGGFVGGTYLVTNNLSFSYANAAPRAAGRYTGRVTYTVTLP
ncbi:MAG: hypothetical protein K0S57_3300 [Ramlibacter sp.]|nr:hypothetical protein [Ramlibacter sp.]